MRKGIYVLSQRAIGLIVLSLFVVIALFADRATEDIRTLIPVMIYMAVVGAILFWDDRQHRKADEAAERELSRRLRAHQEHYIRTMVEGEK